MLSIFSKHRFQLSFAVIGLLIITNLSKCTADYPAVNVDPCTLSGCSSPVSSTTSTPALVVDAIALPTPRILPNGGTFHVSTAVELTADTLPTGAVIEYSLDKGQTWQAGQQFALISGGEVLARLRAGNKVSPTQTALFRLYFERMLVIGNSIMFSPPLPDLGWYNSNGMAASVPEKDFVHLLTANLETLYKPLQSKQQDGGNFELNFGTANYNPDEFLPIIRAFKPDLIVVRIGENINESRVQSFDLEGQYRTLLEKLASADQPSKIVCTTSVWYHPQADAVIRKVTAGKSYSLVDLSCLVGQSQYFASQYAVPIIAAHPNDAGMQRIADLIWEKIQ